MSALAGAGPAPALSNDALLDGRVRLVQPADGYRVAIDPVFLAAAVPAADADAVLDVGAGVGAAALCLASRVAGVKVTGLEAQPDLVRLAAANAQANGCADRVAFVEGDLRHPPAAMKAGSFDHVMANPPFSEAERGRRPQNASRAAATVEGASLEEWLGFCLGLVRPEGSVTIIHRADRLDGVLAGLAGAGAIAVYPLWPGPLGPGPAAGDRPAKRVVVRGRKGSRAPLRLLPGAGAARGGRRLQRGGAGGAARRRRP